MDIPCAIETQTAAETRHVASRFAECVKNGGVIAVIGPLGAGKTTFVQGLAHGLGVTGRVVSPSFTLHRQYGRLHHIDLYRLGHRRDLSPLGIDELLHEKQNVVVIEWAERMRKLPPGAILCRFSVIDEQTRRITIEKT